jgi:hypothetical protein
VTPIPTEALPGKAVDEDLSIQSKTIDAVKDPGKMTAVAIGTIPGFIGAVSQAPDGPIQWALSAAILVMVIFAGFIAYKRFA